MVDLTEDEKTAIETLTGIDVEDMSEEQIKDIKSSINKETSKTRRKQAEKDLKEDLNSFLQSMKHVASTNDVSVKVHLKVDENGNVTKNLEKYGSSTTSRSIPSNYKNEPSKDSDFYFDVQGSGLEGYASITTGIQIPVGYNASAGSQTGRDTVKDIKKEIAVNGEIEYTDSKGNRVFIKPRDEKHQNELKDKFNV